jgi:hypothetical protein
MSDHVPSSRPSLDQGAVHVGSNAGDGDELGAFEAYEEEGWCEALDGCPVELDGVCPHGSPSVLRARGWT